MNLASQSSFFVLSREAPDELFTCPDTNGMTLAAALTALGQAQWMFGPRNTKLVMEVYVKPATAPVELTPQQAKLLNQEGSNG